jgi:hypothetical protein
MHNPLDHRIFVALAALLTVAACADDPLSTAPSDIAPAAARVSPTVKCDADNGDITLPEGFCAVVVADLTIGGQPAAARHLVVTPSGEIFVAINAPRNNQPAFGIVGLRDTTGDGKADLQSQFSPNLGGSGLASHASRRCRDDSVRSCRHCRPHQQDSRARQQVAIVRQHRVGLERVSGGGSYSTVTRNISMPGVFVSCGYMDVRSDALESDAG